jgi:hypothetical protein
VRCFWSRRRSFTGLALKGWPDNTHVQTFNNETRAEKERNIDKRGI